MNKKQSMKKYIIKVSEKYDLYVANIRQDEADNDYGFAISFAPTNLKRYAMQFDNLNEAIELAETIGKCEILEFDLNTWVVNKVEVNLIDRVYPPKEVIDDKVEPVEVIKETIDEALRTKEPKKKTNKK